MTFHKFPVTNYFCCLSVEIIKMCKPRLKIYKTDVWQMRSDKFFLPEGDFLPEGVFLAEGVFLPEEVFYRKEFIYRKEFFFSATVLYLYRSFLADFVMTLQYDPKTTK